MIEINMAGCGIGIMPSPGGGKRVVLADQQTNIRVFFDLTPEGVDKLIADLKGIAIAPAGALNGLGGLPR